MNRNILFAGASGLAILLLLASLASAPQRSFAQEETAAAAASGEQAPEPLSEEELEVLVARIALYPDELVAVISA